ncbi:MAG: response regulator transcription factor [Candidatus Sulfotelmatobacter sp.]|jgi:DNA-binding NarL/FixJ family response regulator
MAQTAIPMPEKLERVKVLAAESTRMNSQLLAEALAQDSRLEVAGVEPNQALILAAVAQQKPHVVLISSTLEDSGTQGFDLARQISASHPGTRLIILMDSFNPANVVQAFRSGAHGVFSRTESSKSLAKCVHSVHQGQVWANSAELRCVIDALRESEPMRLVDSVGEAILSKREQDVVRCVAEGLSNREIASSLGLTEHTVKNYLFRIFDKLGVSSRVEVVLYVYRFRKDWVGASASHHNSAPALGPKLLTRNASRMRPVVPPAVVAGS